MFKKENPIGKWININGIAFKVVGVFEDLSEEDENRMIYMPVSTAQRSFSMGNEISQIVVTIKDPSLEKSYTTVDKIKEILSPIHNFSPEDRSAIFVNNRLEQSQSIFEMLDGISWFTFIISVLTILSGSIGVMNIMVISVNERTKELGIRKAIGAKPRTIIWSIIQEAIFITLGFGYVGMVLGVVVLELLNMVLSENPSFGAARIDLPIAIYATLVLSLVGVLSGLFPAVKAAMIKPVEAMRN